MTGQGNQVRKLLLQQAAIASFGSFALRQSDLHTILTEAARRARKASTFLSRRYAATGPSKMTF